MYTPPQRPPLFTETSPSLPLRDYFAAQAMPLAIQMLKDVFGNDFRLQKDNLHLLAAWAYEIADAMLAKAQKP